MRTIFSKVMWVGRGTVFLVGLSVILALLFGVVTTAAAHNNVDNKLFHLDHNNTVTTALTKLTGNLTGSLLKIDNNGTGPALYLEAGADKAPLTVNAAAGTATGLSADELDGKNSDTFATQAGLNDEANTRASADTALSNQLSSHNHDGRYYASGSKVADSEKLDNKDSTAFGIRTEHNYALAHECDDSSSGGWDVCAPVTVTVPQGKQYIVSVWSSFSAKDDGMTWQEINYCAAASGPNLATNPPCITPFGNYNVVRIHDYPTAASSSGETLPLPAGTYTFYTAMTATQLATFDRGIVITKVMVRDASNGL